jgi:HSP20 family protein
VQDTNQWCYDRFMPWDIRAWQARLERLSSQQNEVWAPAIDVYETADAFFVAAEVPGISREQIDLGLESSRLTIRGHRADRHAGKDDRHFHQIERGFGAFVRTFEFADPIDVERVTADLKDGVLMVSLPKRPAPARRIPVK